MRIFDFPDPVPGQEIGLGHAIQIIRAALDDEGLRLLDRGTAQRIATGERIPGALRVRVPDSLIVPKE